MSLIRSYKSIYSTLDNQLPMHVLIYNLAFINGMSVILKKKHVCVCSIRGHRCFNTNSIFFFVFFFRSFLDLGAGLSVGLSGLAAGFAIGIVGDAGVRGSAQQPRLFVGMILILIFAEVLGLYGLIVALILHTKS